MARWSDRLRDASFRGFPFLVDSAEIAGAGRRTCVHEFPQRALPYVEDLGPGTKAHQIDAYLIGDTVLQTRDRFLAELERPGSGTLVHPYLGTLEVACVEVRVRHSASEGRLVRFGLVFVETAEALHHETFVNPRSALLDSSTAASTSAATAFEAGVVVEGQPAWVLEPIEREALRISDWIRQTDLSGGATGDVARLAQTLDAVGGAAVDLVRAAKFPDALADALNALEASVTSTQDALDAYLHAEAFRSIHLGYESDLGRQADANGAALELLLRQEALARACRVAASVDWASYEDAVRARDELSGRLEALSDVADPEAYPSLAALRARLAGAVPPPERALPRLEAVRPRATTSTLLLSYAAFGDPSHEEEIVRRNDPEWPGFLPAGEPVELLVAPD